MPEDTSPDVTAIQPYTAAGFTLLPLHKWNKKSKNKKGKTREDGKRPIDADWTNKKYKNADQLKHMEAGFNVGVQLKGSQLVIDVDPRNMPTNPDGSRRDTFIELCTAIGMNPDEFVQVITGSGGLHVYMTKPEDIAVVDSLEGYQGVEFKTRGRQVVSAGSIHPSGGMYNWDPLGPSLSDGLLAAPDRLITLIRRPVRSVGQNAGGGEYDPQEMAQMLAGLDPENFRDHEDWLTLMQACHHASNGDARAEFIDWCSQDDAYSDDGWIIGRRWDSLHRVRGDGAVVTYRTLHKYLQDVGKSDVIPRKSAMEDFQDFEGELKLPGEDEQEAPPVHERKGPLEKLNDTYCAVDDGGKFRIYYELFDPAEKRTKWLSMDKANFEAFLSNRQVEKADKKGEPVAVPLATEWMTWGRRRTAKGVIFDPERQHKGFLNLWTGWAVNLIEKTLCSGDKEASDFVYNWIAYMFQKPWEPPEVAITFHGKKGTGKSTLGRVLARIAGRHGRHITSSEHITGRFNVHLMDNIFLFADEAVRPSDKEAENRLKAMITEETLQFEGKGKDLKSGRNRIHVMMASNEEWFVPVGLVDGERRYFVSRVSENRRKDKAFFAALHAQMENGGYAAMLHDLQLRQLDGWAPRGNVPAGDALVEQKLRNMDPLAQWWFNQLDSGEADFDFTRDAYDWHAGPIRSFYSDVKGSYEAYCRKIGVRHSSMNKGTDRYFNNELAKVCPAVGKDKRDAIPDDRMDVKAAGNSGRARAYEFPSLGECRELFELAIEGRVTWTAELQDPLDT
jgi:hypothetical protein